MPLKTKRSIGKVLKRQFGRVLQYLTGIHRIHHIQHSYGYKLPFVQIARFDGYISQCWPNRGQYIKPRWKTNIQKTTLADCDCPYHDCTVTGSY